ncbi:MAG: hypothetical protein U9R36_03485 [Elusimicrobiota bacterium]|nr:hypothetical protein [Elusimicrobiota bacterium]
MLDFVYIPEKDIDYTYRLSLGVKSSNITGGSKKEGGSEPVEKEAK